MLPVLQMFEGLRVDRLIGHYPEDEARVALQVAAEDPRDGRDGEPCLAAAGWHLEYDVRNRSVAPVKPRREWDATTALGKLGLPPKFLPSVFSKVRNR
jgi:hypothetical protein